MVSDDRNQAGGVNGFKLLIRTPKAFAKPIKPSFDLPFFIFRGPQTTKNFYLAVSTKRLKISTQEARVMNLLRAKETGRDMNVSPGDIWIDTKANQMKRRNKANDYWEIICNFPPGVDFKLVIRALEIYLNHLNP